MLGMGIAALFWGRPSRRKVQSRPAQPTYSSKPELANSF
jgi:hypothetical protein